MRVTFGIVNCNRLHYLKACIESLLICTKDYLDKEIIVIDNASIEPGTDAYLEQLKTLGIITVKTKKRNPTNEYAIALNTIVKMSTGTVICPLSGDLQFTLHSDWISSYIDLLKSRNDVGSIMLDAQRKVTIDKEARDNYISYNNFGFLRNLSRPPIATSGNSFYKKEVLKALGPWSENNQNHEGSEDSETKMLKRTLEVVKTQKNMWYQYQPIVPITTMIYTDERGTNARVRGVKLYGKYYPGNNPAPFYYKIHALEDLNNELSANNRTMPIEIEKLATGLKWKDFKDSNGSWKKNPIRINHCKDSDWVFIDPSEEKNRQNIEKTKNKEKDYINDWLKK